MRPLLLFAVAICGCLCVRAAEPQLAVINAVISSSEDGPPIAADYRFTPGDYLYFTFQIAGFAVHSDNQGETKKISLSYEIVPQDEQGRPLLEPVNGEIKTTLAPEDKNWVPKRRASFLLPSFLAAGSFRLHVTAKDVLGKTETSRDVPFLIGGVKLTPATSITIENFRFLRRENDTETLSLAAYSPGDTVFAHFVMTGFQTGPDNRCHVSYGITVLDPSGKAFIQEPNAAKLEEGGFYPAQFVPGTLALQMGKATERGSYTILLEARDLIANTRYEMKQTFSIE
jgi:hypothetical protein